MTVTRSTLFIRRLVIAKSKKTVFDQSFHIGVNIIRGDNSVGKSTVMDLLFYVLGGDLKPERWTEEALTCTQVICEISTNKNILTISRSIDIESKSPMLFFDGSIENAATSSATQWAQYGVRRTDNKYSFSQQLFELLGWPQHHDDDGANLTMHQVLRLIYVDQSTPVNKILRDEPAFDKPSLRQAIGDFLLGVDDLESYRLRQELTKAEASFAKIDGQLGAIYKYVSPTEGILRQEHVLQDIKQVTEHIQLATNKRDEIILGANIDNSTQSTKKDSELIAKKIALLSKDIDKAISYQAEITNEIAESELFLESIDLRIKSLHESKSAYGFFGEIKFEFCPSCLSPIDTHVDGTCYLCKRKVDKKEREGLYLAALNELNFQRKESKRILDEWKAKRIALNVEINARSAEIEDIKKRHRTSLITSSKKIATLNELSTQIGALEERLAGLNSKLALVASIEDLITQKNELNLRINDLSTKIKELRNITEARTQRVEQVLSAQTTKLISRDGDIEQSFSLPEKFEYDFRKDLMLVDGRSKFSASSETILKNSFHLAILLESIQDSFMRYPRLLLLDNIEDKGMRPERSHNFQHTLIESLSDAEDEYQVIMTTSMISPDLEGTDYCVGPYYAKGKHTLEID